MGVINRKVQVRNLPQGLGLLIRVSGETPVRTA